METENAVQTQEKFGHRFHRLELVNDPDTEELMQRCAKCGKLKSISQFHKNKQSRTGYHCWCKNCRSEAKQVKQPTA